MPPTTAARWITRSGRVSDKQPLDVLCLYQIVVAAARHEHFDVRKALELFQDEAAQEAGAAGDDNFSIREVRARCIGCPVDAFMT